jgi:hypothetical protein
MNNSSRELAACNDANPPAFCSYGDTPEEKWEVTYYLDMYLGQTQEQGFPFFKKTGTWILICVNLVPISMMISKEIC